MQGLVHAGKAFCHLFYIPSPVFTALKQCLESNEFYIEMLPSFCGSQLDSC